MRKNKLTMQEIILYMRGMHISTDPEYVRPSGAPRFGISRALMYQWLQDGKVKGFRPKCRGKQQGPCLISVKSIRDYIESHPKAPKNVS